MSILIVVDLPLPLGAQESKDLPTGDVEADSVDRREGSEAFGKSAHRDGCSRIWRGARQPGDSHPLLGQPPAGGHHRSPKDQDREGGEHQ